MSRPEEMRHRTKAFALRVIRLFRSLPYRTDTQVLGKQLLRCGTSVAANYRAVCRARSKAEFIARIAIAAEETACLLVAFALYTFAGAVVGLAEGVAFYFVRRLATLPELIRLRAERSARANLYGSAASGHKCKTACRDVSDDL